MNNNEPQPEELTDLQKSIASTLFTLWWITYGLNNISKGKDAMDELCSKLFIIF